MPRHSSKQNTLYHVTVPVKVDYRSHIDNALIATFTTTYVGIPLTPAEITKIETYKRKRHTSYEEAFMSVFRTRYTQSFLDTYRKKYPLSPDVTASITLNGRLTWAKGTQFFVNAA